MTGVGDLISRYRTGENPLKAERRVELVALVLLLVLALQIAVGLLSIVATSSVSAIAPSQDVLNVGSLDPVAQVTAEARNEIVARPVFWQGRSPEVEAEVVVAKPTTEEATGQKLKGVKVVGLYGSGDNGGAILRVKNDKRRVAVGEEVEGWLLDSVETNSARFIRGASIDNLALERVDASKLVKVLPSASKQEPEKAKAIPEAERTLSVGGTR